MAVSVDDVKLYLRIDDDITEDDTLIAQLIEAATTYIERVTGKHYDDSRLYALSVKNLASHWYENRTNYSTKTNVNDLPLTIVSLINHLSLSSDLG